MEKLRQENCICGNYIIFEKEASEGYEVDENIYEAQVIPENSEQEIIVKKIVSKEKKIRGDLGTEKNRKKRRRSCMSGRRRVYSHSKTEQ